MSREDKIFLDTSVQFNYDNDGKDTESRSTVNLGTDKRGMCADSMEF
jgi:hypothetical protein